MRMPEADIQPCAQSTAIPLITWGDQTSSGHKLVFVHPVFTVEMHRKYRSWPQPWAFPEIKIPTTEIEVSVLEMSKTKFCWMWPCLLGIPGGRGRSISLRLWQHVLRGEGQLSQPVFRKQRTKQASLMCRLVISVIRKAEEDYYKFKATRATQGVQSQLSDSGSFRAKWRIAVVE